MMSTIGRMPVIAAPTPRPVKPASEIGVSMMRSLPNSSTSPVSTLKVVPASATSSPIRTTFGSRRISSAIASLMASPNVSSRTASADCFRHRCPGPPCSGSGYGALTANSTAASISVISSSWMASSAARSATPLAISHSPCSVTGSRCGHPLLLLGLRPVVGAGDVADVVAVIAVGHELQERRAVALARPLDVLRRRRCRPRARSGRRPSRWRCRTPRPARCTSPAVDSEKCVYSL